MGDLLALVPLVEYVLYLREPSTRIHGYFKVTLFKGTNLIQISLRNIDSNNFTVKKSLTVNLAATYFFSNVSLAASTCLMQRLWKLFSSKLSVLDRISSTSISRKPLYEKVLSNTDVQTDAINLYMF